MLKDDILNVFNSQKCLLFAHCSSHRYKGGTQISVMTLRTVYEQIVTDLFLLIKVLINTTCSLTGDTFQVAIQLLVVTTREAYMRRKAVCAKQLVEDDILNVFNFQQCLLFAYCSNYRYDSGTQKIEVTWKIVHENVVADAFFSKKSSSALLVYEQQASHK